MFQPSRPSDRIELCTTNATEGNTNTSLSCQASGTANVKGPWSDIGTANFTYEAIALSFTPKQANSWLVDLGINDGAGNVAVILQDLNVDLSVNSNAFLNIHLPLHIPRGSTISARCAYNGTSSTFGMSIQLWGMAAGIHGLPGYSRAVPLYSPSSSQGAAIDPGGTANTAGSWVELVSSCSDEIAAIFGSIGQNGDTVRGSTATAIMDLAIGAAGSEEMIFPSFFMGWGGTLDGPFPPPLLDPQACYIPKGTRIAARGTCSDNTAGDRTWSLCLMGLVR